MITKATIEKVLNDKTYQVRIPIIDKTSKASLTNNVLSTAVISSQLNCPLNFKTGDVVYVDFEENNYNRPVILGNFYKPSDINSKPTVNLNSIEIIGSVNLSKETVIGKDIKYENILSLQNSTKNIQKQLDEIGKDNCKPLTALRI